MMFNYNVCVVYFKNGKLYRYNVINILVVDLIFLEDVIIGDDWEVRWLFVVVNYILFGFDIIVYEG